MNFSFNLWRAANESTSSFLKLASVNRYYRMARPITRCLHTTEVYHATTDLYSVLKVPRGSTQAEIKSAYYKLCVEHHPDTNQGCSKAQQEFAKISEAYSVLGQLESRRKYDREILQQYPRSRRTVPTQPSRFTHAFKTDYTNYSKGPQFNFDEFYRAHYRNIKQWESERRRPQFGIPTSNLRSGTEDVSQDVYITLSLILTSFVIMGVLIVRYGKDV